MLSYGRLVLIPSFNTLDLKLVWNYEIYNALATPRLTLHVLYSCFPRDANGHTHIHWARMCTQRPRTYGKVILSSFCEGTLALQYGCGRDSPSFYLKTRAGCQALRKMGHPRVRSFVPFLPLCLAGCIWMLMFFKSSCISPLLSAIKNKIYSVVSSLAHGLVN